MHGVGRGRERDRVEIHGRREVDVESVAVVGRIRIVPGRDRNVDRAVAGLLADARESHRLRRSGAELIGVANKRGARLRAAAEAKHLRELEVGGREGDLHAESGARPGVADINATAERLASQRHGVAELGLHGHIVRWHANDAHSGGHLREHLLNAAIGKLLAAVVHGRHEEGLWRGRARRAGLAIVWRTEHVSHLVGNHEIGKYGLRRCFVQRNSQPAIAERTEVRDADDVELLAWRLRELSTREQMH